jgi:hypothetical protein
MINLSDKSVSDVINSVYLYLSGIILLHLYWWNLQYRFRKRRIPFYHLSVNNILSSMLYKHFWPWSK